MLLFLVKEAEWNGGLGKPDIAIHNRLIGLERNINKRSSELLSEKQLVEPVKGESQERIICAAIHNPEEKDVAGKPLIYCGLRHPNILWQSKDVSRDPNHQGFITSKGRFVDRKEGLKIALMNNQVIDKSDIRGDNLYSEDLY